MVIAAGKLGAFDRVERWVDAASAALPRGDALNARIICLSGSAIYLIFGGRYGKADILIQTFESMVELDAQAVALIQDAPLT